MIPSKNVDCGSYSKYILPEMFCCICIQTPLLQILLYMFFRLPQLFHSLSKLIFIINQRCLISNYFKKYSLTIKRVDFIIKAYYVIRFACLSGVFRALATDRYFRLTLRCLRSHFCGNLAIMADYLY